MQLPPTALRVERNTSPRANAAVYDRTLRRIGRAAGSGDLDRALRRLDREWDTERVLETNAAALLLLSLLLGSRGNRRWLWLAGAVAAFLLQHALQGWCPPLPVIRALGIRTAREIDTERAALKTLRGDFYPVGAQGAVDALQAARLE